jgi:hypothetical protein
MIAYFIKKYNLKYEEAYNLVSKKRITYSNPGFINQLKSIVSIQKN